MQTEVLRSHSEMSNPMNDPRVPPETNDSVRRAIEEANAERLKVRAQTGLAIELIPMPSAEDCHRRDAIDALSLLVEEHGVSTVHRWLRTIATARGEEF